MASLRKAKKQAKKMGIKFKTPIAVKRKKLAKQVNEQVRETNKRLRALDKKGLYNTFSSKKLFDRLGGRFNVLEKEKGKIKGIKLRDNMNMTELTAVQKATRNFLKSATSTPFKTKEVIRKTKESIYRTLKQDPNNDTLTMDDIETYYEMLGNSDFDYFNEKFGASSVWAVIDEAIVKGDDETEFLHRLGTLIGSPDEEARTHAVNLFRRYIGY